MPFNGDRLRVLRRFHNYSQRGLAEHVGSNASAINAYENGVREPKGIVLDAICAALMIKPEHFFLPGVDDEFQEHETNFRSLVDTREGLKKSVLAHATLFASLLHLLTTKVKLPKLKLPRLSASSLDDIERAAQQCRVEWGVGADAPIQDVTLMLERAGIVVTVLDSPISRHVDAFSRYGPTNVIVLNPAKSSATRRRMDLGHEGGHGVLHWNGLPAELSAREEQAKDFASALLLPQRAFAREFFALGRAREWAGFFDLKRRWGASVAAIIVRSYHLGLIDAAEYNRRYRYMSKAGWLAGGEPDEPAPETPQLFSLMLRRYLSETSQSTIALATSLNWTPELFRRVSGVDATDEVSEPALAPPQDAEPEISFERFRNRKLAAG